MSASQILQHLYSLDTSSPDISRLTHDLIRLDEEEKYLSGLQGSELARLVNFLDEVLSAIATPDDVSRRCLRKLQVICSGSMTLPLSYTVSGDLTRTSDGPVAFGGYADVWEGTHCDAKVCIKVLRVASKDGPAVMKSFFKEVVIWKRLRHPNVVSFIGVTMEPLQIVSEWIPNGTLTQYVKNNPGASRIGLLLDVAEGLNYLHTNHTIHGDLKGAGVFPRSSQAALITVGQPNVLVGHDGHARLTDFGLASIVRGINSIRVTQPEGYTAGWAAPELLTGANAITQEVDMFAFGTVVIEAFTGSHPFKDMKSPLIIFKFITGKRPGRPQEARELGLVDSVWDMTLSCWQQVPSHRPTAAGVVEFLRECYTLQAANLPLPTLGPWRRAGSMDDATSYPSISPTATSEESTLTRIPGADFQTREISTAPGLFRVLSNSDNSNGGYPPSIMYSARAVRTDNHSTVPTSHICPEDSSSEAVEEQIDEIAEGLAHGNPSTRGERVRRLFLLCRQHRMLPTPYKLEGVVREGGHSKCISRVVEVWKGRYKNEVVALKVLKVPSQGPQMLAFEGRFCEEVARAKLDKHDNIIPLYGVSTTVAPFCLVYPWYKNGNIMDYLKKNPGVNRFDLLSDAARGLCFLHKERLATHGCLRPSHILIDDNGVARLDTQCEGDIDNYRYSAPETQFPKDQSECAIPITRLRDVYGMGMITYEVLTGKMPYSGCDDAVALSTIRAGKTPERPSEGIPDPVWQLLQECWNEQPWDRPPAAQIYKTFSKFRSVHKAVEHLPRKLKLRVQSIKISLDEPRKHRVYVKLKYGNNVRTTSPATEVVAGEEYTWNTPETWLIETDKHHLWQTVSLEVLLRVSMFASAKICATGNFSILHSVNEQVDVKLETPGSTEAVLRIFLREML